MTHDDSRIACESASLKGNPALHKSMLREELLRLRDNLTTSARVAATDALNERLLALQKRSTWTSLAVFWPIRGEPDLADAYVRLDALGVQLALPVVIGVDAPLQFAAWHPGQATQRDRFGVPTPIAPQRFIVPEAILVPCLGANPQRFRLGYGGGFYDRTLASMPGVTAIGIGFACACREFEAEMHDVALDLMLTDIGES